MGKNVSSWKGPATITVVTTDGHGMGAEMYTDKLDMILTLLNHGSIARPREGSSHAGWGDSEHLSALDEIEKGVTEARECIAQYHKDNPE